MKYIVGTFPQFELFSIFNRRSGSALRKRLGSTARGLFAALLCVTGFLPGLQAQTNYLWNNLSDGIWQTGTNWDPSGVPGANIGDTANLIGTGPFTITLSSDVTLGRVGLGSIDQANKAASQITLDLNGHVLNAQNTGAGQLSSLAGRASNSSGDLSMTITNGTFNGGLMNLAFTGGGTYYGYHKTSVRVSGSTAVLNLQSDGMTTPNAAFNQVGAASIGEFIVENGAQLNVSHSSLQVNGNPENSTPGMIRVTGAGSEINASTAVTAFTLDRMMVRVSNGYANSVARLEILDQASLATDDLSIGMGSVGNSGTLLISGSASSLTAKRLFVAGGVNNGIQDGTAATGATTGLLQVLDGADATISQKLSVYGNGTVELDAATLEVSGVGSSAVFDPNSTLKIKLYDQAQAQSLTVGNSLTITNANLSISLSNTFSASLNEVFTVVGYGSRIGTFAGLANLDTFQVDAYTFEIQYNASDITLRTSAVPEPNVAVVGLLGVGLLMGLRRTRRTC